MLEQWLVLELPRVSYARYYLYTEGILYIAYFTMHVLSHSVTSDSLKPRGLYPSQASLPMGILQATIVEWVTMHFSRESSQLRDWTHIC